MKSNFQFLCNPVLLTATGLFFYNQFTKQKTKMIINIIVLAAIVIAVVQNKMRKKT